MIKPDYISFSQEIFDELEYIRTSIRADMNFYYSKEFKDGVNRLSSFMLSEEYDRYLREVDTY